MEKEIFIELYNEYKSNGFDKMDFELVDGSIILHNSNSVVNFLEDYFCIINKGVVATISYSSVKCVAIIDL